MARPKTVQPETNSVSIRNLLMVGGIGLAVRLVLYGLAQRQGLSGNEQTYWYLAHRMVKGDFSHPGILPGWSMVLEFIAPFTDSPNIPRFFVVLLGSLNCVLVAYLGEKQFGRKVSLLAGLLFAFYPEQAIMSHCLYVETFVETLVLGIMTLVFREPVPKTDPRSLAGIGFMFGLSMIVKHFMILPFAGLLAALLIHSKLSWRKASLLLISFATPILIFGLTLSFHQQDPLMILTSPLKSMEEWQTNRPIGWYGYERTYAPLSREAQVFQQPRSELVKRMKANFMRLWGCRSSPIDRLETHFFVPAFPAQFFIWILVFSHIGLLLVGGLGLLAAPPSPFKTSVIAIFIILTSMTAFFYMESRYRDPFMSLLVLFAANFCWSLRGEKKIFPGRTKIKLAASGVLAAGLIWLFMATGIQFFR